MPTCGAHYRWPNEHSPQPGLDIDVGRQVIEQDCPSHEHDWFEIIVVLEGTSFHETVDGRCRVERGDAFAMRPGAWHAYTDCERLVVMNCCFKPRLRERELLWLVEERRLRYLLWPLADDGNVHVRLSEAGVRECSQVLERLGEPPPSEPRPYQLGQLLLLLCRLADGMSANQVQEAERMEAAPAVVHDALRLLVGWPSREWTLDLLSAEVALSPAHLSRLFRRVVGQPPMAYLTTLRAEEAATRLLSSTNSVASVGASVGWSDPNYFARRFRAHFGMSPTEFRDRGRVDSAAGR